MEKQYSQNWFAPQEFMTRDLFPEGPLSYLEIGSYEGKSTCWYMDNILTDEGSQAYCIDTWKGSPEHLEVGIDMSKVEAAFDSNTEEYGSKVVKIKASSYGELNKLFMVNKKFDLVYVDGSHFSWDVVADAVMAFRILKVGGIMGFDDYLWGEGHNRPQPGIDAFLDSHEGLYETIVINHQVWIRKTDTP